MGVISLNFAQRCITKSKTAIERSLRIQSANTCKNDEWYFAKMIWFRLVILVKKKIVYTCSVKWLHEALYI